MSAHFLKLESCFKHTCDASLYHVKELSEIEYKIQ